MVNNMTNTNVNKRYEFGVKIDLLHDKPSQKICDRVSDVREQAVRLNYVDLDTMATEMYNRAYDLFAQGRYKFAPKFTGERYNLLRKAAGLLVLTYRYDKVKWEVTTALAAGTSVAVFSPYKKPDMVKLHSVAQWETLCNREANPDWAAWLDELDIQLTTVLNTETPWLEVASLKELANQYVSFEVFINNLQAEIDNIKAAGEWDVAASESVVYNEKASVAHFVANRGMDKGRRTCSSAYKYGKTEYWYNYETLPVDIMTEYLHLTYLEYINYKPLKRMYTLDGATLTGKEIWCGTCIEDMVRATPIYVDLNNKRSAKDYDEFIDTIDSDVEDLVYNTLGTDFISELGYEEALKVIRYTLTHK